MHEDDWFQPLVHHRGQLLESQLPVAVSLVRCSIMCPCTHKLPSPTKRYILPFWHCLAARAALRAAPTKYPMLPHNVRVTQTESDFIETSNVPNADVPVSATMTSPGPKWDPTVGQSQGLGDPIMFFLGDWIRLWGHWHYGSRGEEFSCELRQ